MSLISINKALPQRDWVIVSLCAGLFVIGAVIKFPDSAYRGLILTTFNFLHFPAFFIVYFLVDRCLQFSRPLAQWGPLLSTIALAVVLELVQPLVARSATWDDAMVSSAGALTAYWATRLKNRWQLRQRQPLHRLFLTELSVFILSLTLMCTYLLKPVYSASYILAAKHQAFPQLSAHQPPLAFLNWFPLPQGTSRTATLAIQPCPDAQTTPAPNATHCVAVTPIQNAWSGLGQVLGADGWHDYQTLELEILTQQPFDLILRIDDTASTPNYGDQYNKQLPLKAGLNAISIPLSALQNLPHRETPLNLDKIRKLYLFIAPTEQPPAFYIRRVFLASPEA